MSESRALTTLSAGEMHKGLQAVKAALAPDLTDDELRLFAMVANRSGLDPFARQVFAIKRKGRVTFQTSIDGYRSIAVRTGMYDGQDEPEYGPWIDKPYGHPEWATVRVYRKGVTRSIAATAFWDEYAPAADDFMWKKMPRVMLAKVAEALALRKAFPFDPEHRQGIGADIYTADEMAQAAERAAPPPVQTTAARIAARRASVEIVESEPEMAVPAEPATADIIECGAVSDPALGAVDYCALEAGHLAVNAAVQRHESAEGSVWPASA